MKTTALLIALTCGCIASTYAQINQQNHQRVDTLSSHYNINPILSHKKTIKPNGFRGDTTVVPLLLIDSRLTLRTPARAFVLDNMTCYKPEGVFSMRIIEPDRSTMYPMLIKAY